MRHLIYNFGNEDASIPLHFVLRRLFRLHDGLSYPEVEHPVLQGIFYLGRAEDFVIWHLGYARHVFDIKKKYENHLRKSNMHSPDYLLVWYWHHALGTFPTKKVDYEKLPPVLTDHFFGKDFLEVMYFLNRQNVEGKHFVDAFHWREYFKPRNAIEVGCGMGLRVTALNMIGVPCEGIELSRWAVEHGFAKNCIRQGDITDEHLVINKRYDLVICYDVLEHLSEEKLPVALNNLLKLGRNFIFSIPFLGDPNLDLDSTHKIRKSRNWWLEQLTRSGFDIKETPHHFLFYNQLVIATVKKQDMVVS
jgi:hypothetical protein